MSGFQMPFSSSPPSTPDRRSNDAGKHWFAESNPSTTPAGPPPPSSAGSFTPAGQPPSSVLGSSESGAPYNNQSFSFSNQSVLKSSNFQFGNQKPSSAYRQGAKPSFGGPRSGLSNEYKASPEPDDAASDEDADGETEMDQDQRESEYSDEGDDQMEDDGTEDRYREDHMGLDNPQFNSSGPIPRGGADRYGASRNSDIFLQSPAMLGRSRSREEDLIDFQKSLQASTIERPKETLFETIAKEFTTQIGSAKIEESDDLILGTEEFIGRLYEEGIGAGDDANSLRRSLSIIPAELIRLWADYNESIAEHISAEYTATIGPGQHASKFTKANFLASLLLRLRHPTPVQIPNDSAHTFRGTLRTFVEPTLETKPIPMLLLEWMDEYHEPYPSQLDELYLHRPSPAHHQLFWETIMNSLLRGKVHGVVTALKNAGWKHARTAAEDLQSSSGEEGYSGKALENIELVIGEATQALSKCPAIGGDWDIRNSDWTLFRIGIQQARENLKSFAEGRNRDREYSELSNTIRGDKTMTATARKAQSQVPWNIYQHLLSVYNLVLGDSSTVVETAMDWCEASIGLVIWWDPSKNHRRSRFGHSRPILSVPETQLYLTKLAESFYRATADSTEFQVNTLNPVEVGLACLFEEGVGPVLAFLRSWSGPISAAVVEIASLGGWLPCTEQSLITMENFDQDDMEVLGITSPANKVEDMKDLTLITYAEALAQHGSMQFKPRFGKAKRTREGWELAIEVLGRLNSTTRSEEEVSDMLKNFTFDTGENVDKMWVLLNDLGMTRHAENVAEKYADSLAEGSFKYGEALWYYALSHKSEKVKNVLDLLISFSLIHSMAFPPTSNTDLYLQRLITSPTATLEELSKLDFDAAQILHTLLAGYATLRRFYDLRDEEANLAKGQKPSLRPIARRAEAISALMAVIASADDNIRGGLFDDQRGAVVGVDFVLALLGEALVFVDQPATTTPPLSLAHIHLLLKTIEDIQTVTPRIYRACNDFFATVVASAQGLKGSSPLDLLRKSSSSLSGAGSFELVGSSLMASQLQRSIAGSGAQVKGDVRRGWDWRKGLSAHMTSEDVLRILRLGLAKDLARAWLRDADNQF